MTDKIYRQRVEQLQSNMQQDEIDVFMAFDLANYYYFTGDMRKQPRALIPQKGDPILFVFEGEKDEVQRTSWIENITTYRGLHEMMLAIIQFFNGLGKEKPVMGIEFGFHLPAFMLERFKMANPNVEIVDSKKIVSPLRMIKSDEEIALIEQACKIATAAMKKAADVLRAGMTEKEVAWEIEISVMEAGGDGLSFPTFVNSGYRSGWLHGMATNKKIEKGDIVLIDVGTKYQGYCGDICRSFTIGPAKNEVKKIYTAYEKIQKEFIDNIAVGKQIYQCEEKASQKAEEMGLGEYYVRGMMHGIGLDFEEVPFPTIFPDDVMLSFQENMTVSIGHAVFSIPKIGGVRFENTYHVLKDGLRQLTHFENGLIEV